MSNEYRDPGDILQEAMTSVGVTVRRGNLNELLYTAIERGIIAPTDEDEALKIFRIVSLAMKFGQKKVPSEFCM